MFLALALSRRSRADPPVEIEVRGDAIAVPPKEPSVAGGVIRRERLNAPGLEAAEVLRTQPGVGVLEAGGYGSLSTASIRGATSAQTPVYLAGLRLNDDVGGSGDLSTIPLWFLNRIEIYRSNAPLAGDQLGIGGAIFFEPRRPENAEAGAGVMTGSFGTRGIWGHLGLANDRASALVGVRVDGARNDYSYLNDNGTRFDRTNDRTSVFANADTRRTDLWATGSARLGSRGRADLVLNGVERQQGLQTFALFPASAARASLKRRLAALTTQVPCAAMGCVLTSTASALFTQAQYDDPLREVALGTDRLDLGAVRIEDALALRWSPTPTLSVSPSVRAAVDRLAIDGHQGPLAHARRSFSRAALQGEWRATERLVLRALGSAECHGTALEGPLPWASPGDKTGASSGSAICARFEAAARAGVEAQSSLITVLATLGRYARVPTLSELYGVSGVVRGNTALIPEHGISFELGARSTRAFSSATSGLSFDVFGFLRQAEELISYQRSAIGYVRPFNIGGARVAGLEVQTVYAPARFLLLELAATLLEPRDTSRTRPTNDLLPYQARLALVPRVEFRTQVRESQISSAKLQVSYFYESSRNADRAGLIVIPPQGSLEVAGELKTLSDHLALRVRVANLLNQARFDLIGYPLPGRAAYLAMETDW